MTTSKSALPSTSVSAVAGDAVKSHWVPPEPTAGTGTSLLSELPGELRGTDRNTPEMGILLLNGKRGHRSLGELGRERAEEATALCLNDAQENTRLQISLL